MQRQNVSFVSNDVVESMNLFLQNFFKPFLIVEFIEKYRLDFRLINVLFVRVFKIFHSEIFHFVAFCVNLMTFDVFLEFYYFFWENFYQEGEKSFKDITFSTLFQMITTIPISEILVLIIHRELTSHYFYRLSRV